MKVHAIVAHLEGARWAVTAGATVVQLRVKARDGGDRRGAGAACASSESRSSSTTTSRLRSSCTPTVCISARATRARCAHGGRGLLLGRSASTLEQALARGRGLPRRGADLGDAVEGRRRARDRPGRGCGRSARRSRSPSSRSAASTHSTPATASGRAPPASPRFARPPIPRCRRPSMRLSESGELGLLAELERLGLIVGVAARRRRSSPATLVVTQDALVEGVHFRLDWLSWRDLGWRAAAVNLSDLAASGAAPEALLVTLVAPASTPDGGRGRALPGHGRDRGARRRRRHDAGAGARRLGDGARQQRARARSCGRAARRRARRHRPARRRRCCVPRARLRPPAASDRGRALARRARARADGHLGRARGRRRPHRPPLAGSAACSSSTASRSQRAPTIGDLAFGEDYELLAAVAEPGELAVIGRVEAGEGVLVLHDGEPVELAGWQHFS